eukprot:CAMPEP_0115274382 /NCGR_PEP_ID=MMETSP0270-20121206/55646_1 /TAXON_ID=71861 /ORGANISM="Scrippsiella trochoidea, Strain CCMP3099" /LENGTH=216 /DNA_ID=CAMNT_0002690891 /DNA_START=45 /DNA_END=696 /DNA_ORIENTATION=-
MRTKAPSHCTKSVSSMSLPLTQGGLAMLLPVNPLDLLYVPLEVLIKQGASTRAFERATTGPMRVILVEHAVSHKCKARLAQAEHHNRSRNSLHNGTGCDRNHLPYALRQGKPGKPGRMSVPMAEAWITTFCLHAVLLEISDGTTALRACLIRGLRKGDQVGHDHCAPLRSLALGIKKAGDLLHRINGFAHANDLTPGFLNKAPEHCAQVRSVVGRT